MLKIPPDRSSRQDHATHAIEASADLDIASSFSEKTMSEYKIQFRDGHTLCMLGVGLDDAINRACFVKFTSRDNVDKLWVKTVSFGLDLQVVEYWEYLGQGA